MKELIVGLARRIRRDLMSVSGATAGRELVGESPGGDAQFGIDEIAERAITSFLRESGCGPIAVYTEDRGLTCFGANPRHLLVIDPIDGTRPAAAGLDLATVSIAAAPMSAEPRLADVTHALLLELGSGRSLYAGPEAGGLSADGYAGTVPALGKRRDLGAMFWSFELNGHPMNLMSAAYGRLVDASANTGGVFVFNSATFSISRIITGQLDAYVDIGNRLLKDHPATEPEFLAAGHGHILHLFPYDIAAAVVLAERAGVVITDGYGRSLGPTLLLDVSAGNQQSCVAAANPVLHARLLEAIDWQAGADGPREPKGVPGGEWGGKHLHPRLDVIMR